MKKIIILGSTGSIGQNTLNVVREHPNEFEIVGLSAGSRAELLAQQARSFGAKKIALADTSRLSELKHSLDGSGPIELLAGDEGVADLAAMEGVDLVVLAITGAAALQPALNAISKGRTLGLANKETLVMAGELMTESAKAHGATLLPIDSEHSAIFQCLEGHLRQEVSAEEARKEVRRILLTTSGGPLRNIPLERFGSLSKEQIMDHPRWKMGPKITVDSATMMNKALEVIETRWLFGMPIEKVQILVHPEAIVHSLVEYIDGSILAQLAVTDMRIPIQYAMTYPKRLPCSLPALDLVALKQLTFEAPNPQKFPCLAFGYEAARQGGTLPAVLNAANEACVEAFLQDRLAFVQIPALIEKVLKLHHLMEHPGLDEIRQADAWAREQVTKELNLKSVLS